MSNYGLMGSKMKGSVYDPFSPTLTQEQKAEFLVSDTYCNLLTGFVRGITGNPKIQVVILPPFSDALGYTDGDTIYLCTVHEMFIHLPIDTITEFILAVALHEPCHVRYTDFKYWNARLRSIPTGVGLYKWLFNAICDARIERIGAIDFPGIKHYLINFRNFFYDYDDGRPIVGAQAVLNNILLFATCGKVKFPMSPEHEKIFEQCRPYIIAGRRADTTADCDKNVAVIFDLIYDIVKNESAMPENPTGQVTYRKNGKNFKKNANTGGADSITFDEDSASSSGSGESSSNGNGSASGSSQSDDSQSSDKNGKGNSGVDNDTDGKDDDAENADGNGSSNTEEDANADSNNTSGTEDDADADADADTGNGDADDNTSDADGDASGEEDENPSDTANDETESDDADSSGNADNSAADGDNTYLDGNDEETPDGASLSDMEAQASKEMLRNAIEGSIPSFEKEKEQKAIDQSCMNNFEGKTNRTFKVRCVKPAANNAPMYTDIVTSAAPVIKHLVAEMRKVINWNQDEVCHKQPRGFLDNQSLLYAYRGTCFGRRIEKSDEADLFVSIVVDSSGSMSGQRLVNTAVTAAIILEACSALNIPISIKGFSSNSAPCNITHYWDYQYKNGNCKHNVVQMYASGSTPLAEALAYEKEYLSTVRFSDKLCFVLTDGEPDSTRDAIAEVSKLNQDALVYGVAIGDDVPCLQRIFGESRFIDARDISTLPFQIGNIIKRNIIK